MLLRPHFTRHPPEDFADFERLMAVLAGHYRGTIDHWEIWNEPDVPAFWSGTPEEYVKLLEAGYRGVRKGNPEAVVIGGGGLSLSNRDFTARVLDAGLVEHLDVLSIHGYSDATTPLGEGLMKQMLEKLRNDIADSGGREDLPIWVTEHTTFSLSFFERYWPTFERQRRKFHFRRQSARLVREHVMALAGGVDRVFYYWFWPVNGFFEHSPVNGAMTEPSGAPKPIAVAYAVLAWMIDGKEYIGEIDLDRELIHACLFDGAAGPAVVAWSLAGEQTLMLPRSEIPVTVRNLMGNTIKLPEDRRLKLSSEPVYIQSGPDVGAEKLAAMLSLQPE